MSSIKLAMKLKAARRAALLTQHQAAAKLGISRSAIALWESVDPAVRNQPSMENLVKFAEATGLPVGWFMNENYPVGSVHRVRNMALAGGWVDDAPPPDTDATLSLRPPRIEDSISLERAMAMASALRNHIPRGMSPEREQEMEDRKEKGRLAESFWRSAEFTACTQRKELEPFFDQRMMLGGEIPMRADFLNRRCVIRFGGVEPEAGPAGAMTVKRLIADLLMVEAINKAPLRKILVYWDDNNEKTPRRYLNEADFKTALGIEILIFKSVEELTTLLVSL